MQKFKKLVCLLTLAGIFHAPLQAHDKNFGYLHDNDGELIVNSLGECIRTTSWTAETATPECEGDADQDGIADSDDKCLGTPAGVMVDATGCEKDSDKDGVMDSADSCSGTASGVAVDSLGCAIVIAPVVIAPVVIVPTDADNDGIADLNDQCPDSEPGVNVDATGCKLKKSYVLEGVTFVTGSDEITESSSSALDKVADTMIKNDDINVEVAGYTDDRGDSDFNQALSLKRAESVKAYLQSSGVAAGRMKATGYGEDAPIADNSTAAGREKNRRVELHIIE